MRKFDKTFVMQRIVLEVDDMAGKVYGSFSPESRQQFDQMVSLMIKKGANDVTFAEYSKLLDDIGAQAVKNGLNAEILESLLASE